MISVKTLNVFTKYLQNGVKWKRKKKAHIYLMFSSLYRFHTFRAIYVQMKNAHLKLLSTNSEKRGQVEVLNHLEDLLKKIPYLKHKILNNTRPK